MPVNKLVVPPTNIIGSTKEFRSIVRTRPAPDSPLSSTPAHMNRRTFLTLAGATAPLAPVLATSTDAPPLDDPADLWWPMIRHVDQFRAVSLEGRLTLDVTLATPGEEELELIEHQGRVIGYSLRGRRLIDGYYPGVTVVDSFTLTWDGEPIPILSRFWNDLAGFRIQVLDLDLQMLDAAERARIELYRARLDQPRITLSADAGTALIEWVRPEECDARSTFRWIVSRSGNILRHRERPPHEC